MNTIQLKKFGTVLISRPAGLEAFNAIRPQLNPETLVQIDFDHILTGLPRKQPAEYGKSFVIT